MDGMDSNRDRGGTGRYPDHTGELGRSRYPLGLYREGIRANRTPWGHGGYICLEELPAGVAVRESNLPGMDLESVMVRILMPAGGWMGPALMEGLAEIAARLGMGWLHLTTGGTLEIETDRGRVLEMVRALNTLGLDVGSTGDGLRALSSCCGPLRCEQALLDAPALATYLGERFIDDQQFPGFPHKCKVAVAGCPNDCVRSMTQKDMAFVGTFDGPPVLDEGRLEAWLKGGGDGEALCRCCPTGTLSFKGGSLLIEGDVCNHCLACLNACPALRPGQERGVAWVIGAKHGHRGPRGPMTGMVLLPFLPLRGAEDFPAVGDLMQRFLRLWCDEARRKERIGDFVYRFGPARLLEALGLPVDGRMVMRPRTNVFYRLRPPMVAPGDL